MSCVTNNTVQLIRNFGFSNISVNILQHLLVFFVDIYVYIFNFLRPISLSNSMTLVITSEKSVHNFNNYFLECYYFFFQILTYMIYLGIQLVPNT